MARLVNWKTFNEGSSLEEKFELEVEFHKSHHKDDLNGQPGTSAKVDQQGLKLNQNTVRKGHHLRKKSPTCLLETEKEELLSHRKDMLREM